MNKVVCNICGTSYPENATQCPICGYVQTADHTTSANSGDGTYTYVKGGRFSKANVKKRNQSSGTEAKVPVTAKKKQTAKKQQKQKSNTGMIVLIIVLLLAIIAVLGYIALRFLVPNNFLFEGLDNLSISVSKQETDPANPVETTVPVTDPVEETMVCTAVVLNSDAVQLDGSDNTFQLSVSLEPVDFHDTVTYSSSDEGVAMVDANGLITAVGDGTAVITVTCGDVSSQCTVECKITKPLELNRKEITFSTEGESWVLYNGDIPVNDITWTSDDNSVATIEAGKVTAVANGDTTVFGIYNDETVACLIHCKFDEVLEEHSNISEADGNSTKAYKLHNPYGFSDDVTMNVGEKFTLKLVDDNLEEAADVSWSVKSESVCTFSDNTVTAVGSGVTEVTATCDGKTYTCVVRVK